MDIIDPNNFSRVVVALERWVRTGELLAQALEKTGDTANFPRTRAIQEHVQTLKQTIAQLRG